MEDFSVVSRVLESEDLPQIANLFAVEIVFDSSLKSSKTFMKIFLGELLASTLKYLGVCQVFLHLKCCTKRNTRIALIVISVLSFIVAIVFGCTVDIGYAQGKRAKDGKNAMRAVI